MCLFFRYRGAHPTARLRSLVVPSQPPKLSSFRVGGSYPRNPLARVASLFLFSFRSSAHSSSRRCINHSQVSEFPQKKKRLEQRIRVAEALAGLRLPFLGLWAVRLLVPESFRCWGPKPQDLAWQTALLLGCC